MLLTEKLGSDVKSEKGSFERARGFGLTLVFLRLYAIAFSRKWYTVVKKFWRKVAFFFQGLIC